MIKNAEIITQSSKKSNTVTIGSTVTVKIGGETKIYTIVGSNEANPSEGKISNESLVGKVLLGKKLGDKVTISTPAGEKLYEIIEIS